MNQRLPLEPIVQFTASSLNQRWRNGRTRFKPSHETIDPLQYEVALLPGDAEAKAFVVTHHYSGTYPAARFRVGLFRGTNLVGVAIYSHPANDRVLTSVFPGPPRDSVELGRFVLLDDVPGNGESWFLARSFQYLRAAGIRGVLSFSDPIPRFTTSGEVVTPGHVGTIYQASNGRYLGRSTPRRLRLLPNGQVLSDRALQKLRAGERGWKYVAEQLHRAGASTIPEDVERRPLWIREQLLRLTRPFRHPGNHRYAWSLDPKRPVQLASMPYPKLASAMTHHAALQPAGRPARSAERR
jgi:hypothetical protein